jgi:serine/threonine-protein kinase HipA
LIATIARSWAAICGDAKLSMVEQGCLGRRQFLNGYAMEGYVDGTPKF